MSDVVLVNPQDEVLGVLEKIAAHEQGLLHRAFSVFILQQRADDIYVLMQQREKSKYHCGGLWTNSCCSHPNLNEDIVDAGVRRLQEEMGITGINLTHVGSFQYHAEFSNGLIEHELDHVLIGYDKFNLQDIPFNTEEVQAYKWQSLSSLKNDLINNQEMYTPWIGKALELVIKHLKK